MKKDILNAIKYIGIFVVGGLIIGYIFELSIYIDPYLKNDRWLRNILIFFWGIMCLSSILSKKDSEVEKYSEEDMLKASKYGYDFHKTTQFPDQKFEDSCINNTKQWLRSIMKK